MRSCEHLADQAPSERESAVALLDVPAVAAEHHPRLVGQDLDRLVQGELEVGGAEQKRPGQVEPDVAVDERHAEQVTAPRIGEVHEQEARARMALDEPGDVHRVRSADESRAEVHLDRHVPLAGEGAEAVDDEVAEGLLLGRARGCRFPKALARERLVRLVEAQVTVVGERVLERDLVPAGSGVDEQLEEGEVVVERVELNSKLVRRARARSCRCDR